MTNKVTNKVSAPVFALLALIMFGTTIGTAKPGDLDRSFSGDGKVTDFLSQGNDDARGIAVQSDGKIVFSSDRDGNREIYVMNGDGTAPVRLTNNSSFDDFPDWSPDGQKIAFLSHRTNGVWAVFIMNNDGTGRIEVTQANVPNLNEHISWSPDGRRIAFYSVENGAGNIVVVNTDGTNRQTIANGTYPSWSPDGSKILFSTGAALYTIRPDGSDLRLVLTTDPARDIYHLHEPGWSPDGQNIIFGVTDSWDFLSIFKARADGSVLSWVAGGPTVGHATNPDWSPDGGKFVYTSYTSNGQGWIEDISKANINGSGHTRLTTSGNNYNPSWQPNDPTGRTRFDFDGDGRADISVFRPSDRVWYLDRSTQGFSATQFGLSTDKITPADFDGDGRTDISVYRDGVWYWLTSSDNSFNAVQFGLASDIPVPADHSGDGRAELAVYRNGVWWSLDLSNNQVNAIQFGLATDKPVVADYDGDGRADQAIFRNGEWHLNRSSQGYAVVRFGLATDKPAVGDYDSDGKADQAVYRDGIWYVLRSSEGFTAFPFGLATDIPAPADYDGDGKTDAAVVRDGVWYLRQTTGGISIQQFGSTNDKPVPAAYLP